MPTSPFLRVGGPYRAMVGDASEHTRFLRMAAEIAPQIVASRTGAGAGRTTAPKNVYAPVRRTQTTAFAPLVYGFIKSSVPNNS
jgi:hypothetical protein